MILQKLRAIPGSIMKEQCLRKEADTYDKKMFQYAYDTDKMYHIKYNNIRWDSVRPFTDLDILVLDKLWTRLVTGHAARDMVDLHCKMYGDLVKLICNKDLDCGVSARTLNKVFGPDFIPLFSVQLAKEVPLEKVKVPLLGQLKYNGVRVVALVDKHKITFKTRNGKTFQYPALSNALNVLDRPIMLDGELTTRGCDGHTNVSGIVNSAIHGNYIAEYHNLSFTVFDAMPLEDFHMQQCEMEYTARFDMAKKAVEQLPKFIKLAETYEFKTHEDIHTKFEELLAEGHEGLILKRWNHLYTFKRSSDWIKMKAVKTADLKCVDIQEGEGKYADGIGALICEGIVEGKRIKVNVGSGLSDHQRSNAWDCFLDQIIEVKYNTIIQDTKTGQWSLFLPRFVTIRGDL